MEHLLAERVKEIMEDLGYTPSSFADTIDVPRPIISHILSGRNKPSLDVIQKVLMRFPELNPWWLLTGTGTMKQLNLFSDQELEAISITKAEVQQAHAASQPVKALASPAASVEKPTKTEVRMDEAIVSAPVSSPVQPKPEPAKPIVPAELPTQAFQNGKTVEKMIVFYTDKTFAVYHPE